MKLCTIRILDKIRGTVGEVGLHGHVIWGRSHLLLITIAYYTTPRYTTKLKPKATPLQN